MGSSCDDNIKIPKTKGKKIMQCRFLQDLKGQEMRDESHEKNKSKKKEMGAG